MKSSIFKTHHYLFLTFQGEWSQYCRIILLATLALEKLCEFLEEIEEDVVFGERMKSLLSLL